MIVQWKGEVRSSRVYRVSYSWKAGILVLVLIVVAGVGVVYGVTALDKPQIESMQNEWGTVTTERTEVETKIALDNPFALELGDAVADVNYTVSLNDVDVATGQIERVRLDDSGNAVNFSTWIDNDDISRWWVTHVNNNQTTTVRIDPDVVLQYVGNQFPAESFTRNRTVYTDLLAPLQRNSKRRFEAFGRTVLVVNETDARWGHATAERTPIHASVTATNPLPVPLPITEINYTIRMNGITVGHGVAASQTMIPSGGTRTFEANATIDNSRLDEWWVTHVRNNETSQLTVEFNATVAFGGVERHLPLEFVSFTRTFETNVLESNRSASALGDSDGGRRRAVTAAK